MVELFSKRVFRPNQRIETDQYFRTLWCEMGLSGTVEYALSKKLHPSALKCRGSARKQLRPGIGGGKQDTKCAHYSFAHLRRKSVAPRRNQKIERICIIEADRSEGTSGASRNGANV